MSNIIDHLLSEILIRLPNCRDVVQCKSVCKRWCSLISSPEFIRTFIHHRHQHRHWQSLVSDSHLSMLLFQRHRFENKITSMPNNFQFCQVFGDKRKNFRESFLNFLPWDVIIRASADDLLLVSKPCNFSDFYICNPVTRKWVALPQAPPSITKLFIRCGLVRLPYNCNKQEKCTNNAQYRYKVVVFGYYSSFCAFSNWPRATIFCSETTQWSKLVDFQLPHPLKSWTSIGVFAFGGLIQILTCNGILHWLESSELFCWEGIVAFDPFTDVVEKRCRFVALPFDIDPENEILSAFISMTSICLGNFQGRLRLCLKCEVGGRCGLKVWELREYDQTAETSWSLVHNVALEIRFPSMIFPLALHPSISNVVFLLCRNELIWYNMSEGKSEKLAKFPFNIEKPSARLSIFPLMHSSWHTPVPALPL
ncbi:hypothetical protein UlMin_027724 [Ulmus minor]